MNKSCDGFGGSFDGVWGAVLSFDGLSWLGLTRSNSTDSNDASVGLFSFVLRGMINRRMAAEPGTFCKAAAHSIHLVFRVGVRVTDMGIVLELELGLGWGGSVG